MRPTVLTERLDQLAGRFGPVFTIRDAGRVGIGGHTVRELNRQGRLVGVGKGTYALANDAGSDDEWEAFRRRAIAFGLTTSPDTYLSEWAAVAIHRLPHVARVPGEIVGIRIGHQHSGPSRSSGRRVRYGPVPIAHRQTRDRVHVISPAFTAIEVARHATPLDGLLVADAVLHQGVQREVLGWFVDRMLNHPGIDQAKWVATQADGRAESPIETLGRYAFISAGRQPPLANVWITDGDRRHRVDLLLAEAGVVLEADGAVKYNNRPDAADLVTAEKERERRLRALGFGVVRFDFATALHRPDQLIHHAMSEAARLAGPVPTCWSYDMPQLLHWA